ncbi:hypothetical protein EJF18_10195 [Clavispora lusitaniae]|uniref:Uncharacterized protein n=1 Tax=Clavispora lusitaniae TaxID=36911 RepID=A0ACD0WCD8_CLALS|nr:hypothetical protein EJF14_10195 [Clavispora lusitaniae]QFZ31587.1 hypothetical protein EJF16_10195 [Clavispora lusitaniae]QFZ37255.1 hypothetical protein EJF15_10195 [Clavispora lusitaniae]QFZ42939.1 hypothetical protein EJF18_10195 [Clavispora lusitaniae]QFZ48615.1 hypothetical protein EJF17_10195 [Clavispora lusitaniae]
MHDGPLLLLPATNSSPPKIEIGPQAELRGGEKKFYKIISSPENEAKQRKRLLYPSAADQKVARNGTGGYVVTAGQMSIFFFASWLYCHFAIEAGTALEEKLEIRVARTRVNHSMHRVFVGTTPGSMSLPGREKTIFFFSDSGHYIKVAPADRKGTPLLKTFFLSTSINHNG